MQQRLVTERRVGIGRESIYALGVGGVGEGGDVLFSGFWGVLLFLGCFLGFFLASVREIKASPKQRHVGVVCAEVMIAVLD